MNKKDESWNAYRILVRKRLDDGCRYENSVTTDIEEIVTRNEFELGPVTIFFML